MAEVKWIKISTGLPDNRKLKQIRKLPEGDTIALMWVFLICLAGNVNENGMIYFTPEIPYTDEMLAEEFKIDINTIRLGLQTFQKFGMMEIIDSVICLPSWEKWQSTDRLSEIREYNRLAKQKSRVKQKQKLLEGVNDMSMTSQRCHDTEEDKDKEKEEEIEKERDREGDNNNTDSKPNRKAAKKVIYFPLDDQLNSTFLDFIEMRKKIKAPMTERAITLMLNKIDKLAGTDSVLAINILEQSILNGWKDVYPLKDNKNNTRSSGEIDWSKV